MYINQDNFHEISNKITENMVNQTDISFNSELQKDLKAFKDYLLNNENNQLVKEYKQYLALYFQSFFTDSQLFPLFNLQTSRKYYKIQEISKQMPFHLNNIEHPNYLYHILDLESKLYGTIANNTYPACFHLFDSQNVSKISDIQQKQILDFVKEHQSILTSGRDRYLDIRSEIANYNDATHHIYHETFYPTQDNPYEKCVYDYINKILGKIGELFIVNGVMKQHSNLIHVAKELGNGHGYDIYDYINCIEKLIEVKTTAYSRTKDYFFITDNELKVMAETMLNPLADYYIYRVFYYHPNNYRFDILTPLNEETLQGQTGAIYKLKMLNDKRIFSQE